MRLLLLTVVTGAMVWAAPASVTESKRRLPVAYDVDVLVVGGSTGAVAAAVAAARAGARVFVAAPRTYLGEDLCATMRLWLEPGEEPDSPLSRKLFAPEALTGKPQAGAARQGPFRPAHVKKVLDDALLAAHVPFLYGTYVSGLLRDAKGRTAGAVIVNRAGRQAVLARVVIDATGYASVARMAGAAITPIPPGPLEFRRVVVGGPVMEAPELLARKLGLAYHAPAVPPAGGLPGTGEIHAGLIEYRLRLPMPDLSYASFMAAEHRARELTSNNEVQADTDSLFQVPPFHAITQVEGPLLGNDEGPFRVKSLPGMYVLSGMAGVPREDAERLLRPLELMRCGERVGLAAAREALAAPPLSDIVAAASGGEGGPAGDVLELLNGLRPSDPPRRFIDSPRTALPVLGEYDVVVVGGGTGGAPAAIAASQSGARTLVLEYLHQLGGVGTLGRITLYWRGYRGGFTRAVGGGEVWNAIYKAEWWRRTAINFGADVWFGAMGCGAFVEDRTVRGVVVATPFGRGVILAKTVVDSTGNADIAAAAGADVVHSGTSEVAWQGTGLPAIRLGGRYHNTDFTITDETDALDTWNTLVYAKEKYKAEFDIGQLIDSRERRRVVGDLEITVLDEMMRRRYPDTIALAFTDYDTHGYTIDPYFWLEQPKLDEKILVNIPYRCLLPRSLNNILVTGLGISVHRDALPLVRMQADIQNHGYAAGLAASMAALRHQGDARAIDIKRLQRHLVQMEIVPETVLTDRDSFPLTEDQIEQAVDGFRHGQMGSAAILLHHPEQSSPLLRRAWSEAAKESDKLRFALALAALDDPTGAETLLAAVRKADWDPGWHFQGMGQYGSSMSSLDKILVALGHIRDQRAVEPLIRLMDRLTAESEFSHYRAVSLALESIGSPRAAPALAQMLARPGIRGHVQRTPEDARRQSGASPKDESARANSLRELGLARALFRCGDRDQLGRQILTEYCLDLRGPLAAHARALLETQSGAAPGPQPPARSTK